MKIAIFGTKSWDKKYFLQENNKFKHDLFFIEEHLNSMTAALAKGCHAVCAFVNDELDEKCLRKLSDLEIRTVALRCAGFNNVNISAASTLNIEVVRVPEYSPHGVAEHAVTLILALNRKIYKSYNRVREGNFLLEGLLGFNLNTKTVGVVGTGKIGSIFCKIMRGFGCTVLAYDPYENEECLKNGVIYSDLETLLKKSDIISIHCPLTPNSHHFINEKSISLMKDGVMLINTSRGALIDTTSVIKSLKSGKIGYLGLDTYEEEAGLFFEDVSNKIIGDDILARLLTFSNVLITGHQAFFTTNALENIAKTTLQNLTDIEQSKQCPNLLTH
ncbi:MAG: 2-hydroxyacid dehydrogenase [Candidatus Endonucleobacter bathymodioli]|uniref:2-hydroxyacid dehydrogenase n=1 Tax=Candidatus Endonucleibacter bathymodioli TaxID=539814 RepID=A0AA90NXB5_9GAMM|nr:2-hydroxyacid dehydrogenase [Candidatus Endonucleobacter bathymodioli]